MTLPIHYVMQIMKCNHRVAVVKVETKNWKIRYCLLFAVLFYVLFNVICAVLFGSFLSCFLRIRADVLVVCGL